MSDKYMEVGDPDIGFLRAKKPAPEWDNEPNRKHWVDEATGLDCLIVRGPLSALCGYVGVPSGHAWYGKGYFDIKVSVHGGLTYASACDETGKICHSHDKGDNVACEDVWWLGFDCVHLGDLAPKMGELSPRYGFAGDVYRNLAYVEAECKSLAAQVRAAT